MSSDAPIIIEPRQGQADAAVILLHGLGASGHDLAPLIPALGLPDTLKIRVVLPHAPILPVTVNGGTAMPAWYDILEMNLGRRVDETQLRASAGYIHELIDQQIDNSIDSRRIIIAGFSQGGAVAYEAALSYSQPLAGLLALSTYFATQDSITLSDANQKLSVEVHHGSHDSVVPESLGRAGAEAVRGMGYPVNYRTYPMGHEICAAQIGDISHWLNERLAP
ncbi:alpha/beta hydrolase [Phytohalomonas tamaricis]|uniref:alpha/beta hydrolase n=1 Tax=Phytohalomonas tamaricis TaxID=2081032 RepID=UPI000D0B72AE|nr:alpha/beta fold hydrolase [Phytohalomonas tamaricis]